MIKRQASSQKNNLSFDYNPMGQRTAKHVYTRNDELLSSTYYILDAQGNVMTTYEMNIDTANTSLTYFQSEKHIYGSSRLGMLKDSVNVLGSAYGNTDSSNVFHSLGNKRYELSNHLGNVLTVISDKPIPHNNGGTVDYWQADIKSAYDYSPFGVQLDGRTMERTIQVCTEVTDTVTAYALNETFDSGGSWTSMDFGIITYPSGEMMVATPTGKGFPHGSIGAYKTFTTAEGLTTVSYDITFNNCKIISMPTTLPRPIYIYIRDAGNTIIAGDTQAVSGNYLFTFNAPAAGTYKIEFYKAMSEICRFNVDNVLISSQETITNTVCETIPKSYRYGYQGSEKDNEVKGKGNSYTTFFRQLDPRLGRWLTIDPVVHAWQSSYASMDNNPIWHNDVLGDDVGYESKGDKRRVKFKALISKDFREKHKARLQSNDLFTYRKRDGKPSLNSPEISSEEAPEGESRSTFGVLYDKAGLSGNNDSHSSGRLRIPEIDISWQYSGKSEVVEKKGTIKTPKQESNPLVGPHIFESPKRWVAGTEVNFRAATHPDQFTFTDGQGNNIVPPFTIVQSSISYVGVTNVPNAWLSVPTTTSISSWSVNVMTKRYFQPTSTSESSLPVPNSVFYIQYTKYKGLPIPKISISW